MFGRALFSNPYEQLFGGYPFHQLQNQPFGIPLQHAGMMGAGLTPFTPPQVSGFGPISPLVPQQGSIPGNPIEQILGLGTGSQYGVPATPFAQSINQPTPFAQYGGAAGIPSAETFAFGNVGYGVPQSWQQRDPRAEILANTIAQITATRDPRVEYLAQVVTHPAVASNPILKDLVAKELLTAALQQVSLKPAIRPDVYAQPFPRGGEQIGFGQGIDPYTAAAVRSQVLAEIANSPALKPSPWGARPFMTSPFAQSNPQAAVGMPLAF